jgi:hypothetical protein
VSSDELAVDHPLQASLEPRPDTADRVHQIDCRP